MYPYNTDKNGEIIGDVPLYSVPYDPYGKFFANDTINFNYYHPPMKGAEYPSYKEDSNPITIALDSDLEANESKTWVHINPLNLDKVTKRLIRINKAKKVYRLADIQAREVTELKTKEVVHDNTAQFMPDSMVRLAYANKHKYYPSSMDFKIGDIVIEESIKDQNANFINVPSGKTEYYAFKSLKTSTDQYSNKIGRLLKRYTVTETNAEGLENDPNKEVLINDYEIRNGGIVLRDEIADQYDYIYAITYEFRQQHNTDGFLVRKTVVDLDTPDQLYVGPCTDIPVVFMDGLYLEHYDKEDNEIYIYENDNIKFKNNVVLDDMQIMVVSFPKVNTYLDGNNVKHPREYSIDETKLVNGVDIVIDCGPDNADTLFDEKNFPNPFFFYSGLAGYTYAVDEKDVEIDYTNKTLTLRNFGEIVSYNGTCALTAVSLGPDKEPGVPYNYRGQGVLEDGVFYDENVHADTPYLVFVDGIAMSPYNEDITIEDVEIEDENGKAKMVGKVTITAATVALDSEYTIIQLTDPNSDLTQEQNENCIMCVYDDMFAAYSIPLNNPNAYNTTNAYNDCDSAVVMCGPGALVDRESVQLDFDPNAVFVGGQIVKSRLKSVTTEEVYEWRQYLYSNDYVVLDPNVEPDRSIIYDCENFITYHASKGTIMVNPNNIKNEPITVYAYTYVDSVDEKIKYGRRVIPINVEGNPGTTVYSTNRTHLYDIGVNALSTYVNGVMMNHVEEMTSDVKADLFTMDKLFSSKFIPFTHRYEEETIDFRWKEQDMWKVLKHITDDSTLDTALNVDGDECLFAKFFNSEHQLEQAKGLKRYIDNEMKNNTLLYLVENIESNEFVSARRHWNVPLNENVNLPNSYVTTMRLMPGIINVYVNGVLLEKDDYAIFDNNKLMVGFDLVGGQGIMPKNKGDYAHPYRVMTDEGFKFIECENDDEVLIEVRDDLKIKKRSYEIKDISYDTYTFDILDYEYPKSLSFTKDFIKIYINGVLYDGNYTNTNGVITLLECDLEEDPLWKHFKVNPSDKKKYEEMYGEYIKHVDIITFEWR